MTERIKTRCRFCSLGCGCFIETAFGQPVGLEYDRDDPVGGGALCSKGNYLFELLDHPLRLTEPKWNGALSSWENITSNITTALNNGKPGRTGLILDGLASTEDIAIARAFAQECVPGCRFGVHIPTGEDKAAAALADMLDSGRIATLDEVAASACTVAVGDPFAAGPVIAGRVLDARYRKRGNLFAAIAETPNQTTRLANAPITGPVRANLLAFLHVVASLRKGDGWLADVRKLAAPVENEMIRRVAQKFADTPAPVLLIQTGDPVTAQLATLAVLAAGDTATLYHLTEYANAGVSAGLDGTTPVAAILDAAASGGLDTLIILGSDVLGGMDAAQRDAVAAKVGMIAVASPFDSETSNRAHAVLPSALWCEYSGTYAGEKQDAAVSPPGAAGSYGDMLTGIAAAMNRRLTPAAPPEKPRAVKIDSDLVRRIVKEAEKEAPQQMMPGALSFGDGFLTGQTRWVQLAREVRQ